MDASSTRARGLFRVVSDQDSDLPPGQSKGPVPPEIAEAGPEPGEPSKCCRPFGFTFSWSLVLVLLQAAVLFALVLRHGIGRRNFMLGPASSAAFDEFGAKNAAKIRYEGQWWRLLSAVMLHGGCLHLACNAHTQLRLCATFEAAWGSTTWLMIYVVSGTYASLVSCLVFPDKLACGSSGALFGLMGAQCCFLLMAWDQVENNWGVANAFIQTLLINLVLSFVLPFVDWAGHLGGLLMGAVMAACLFAGQLQSTGCRWATRVCACTLLAALVAGSLWWFLFKTEPNKHLLDL